MRFQVAGVDRPGLDVEKVCKTNFLYCDLRVVYTGCCIHRLSCVNCTRQRLMVKSGVWSAAVECHAWSAEM